MPDIDLSQTIVGYVEHFSTWDSTETTNAIRIHINPSCSNFTGGMGAVLTKRALFDMGRDAGINNVSSGENSITMCRVCS